MAHGKQSGSGILPLALENKRTMPAPPSLPSVTSDPIEVGFRASTPSQRGGLRKANPWVYQPGHLVPRTEEITS